MLQPTKSLLGLLSAVTCLALTGPQTLAYDQCEPEIMSGDPSSHRFGTSVAISGSAIAVGAPLDSGAASDAGAVYLFERQVPGWAPLPKLTVGTAGGELGHAVSIDGSDIAAGGYAAPPQHTGAAYRFNSKGTTTIPLIPNPAAKHLIGYAVAIDGDTSVVTAPGDDGAREDGTGVAYVFERHAVTPDKLVAPDGVSGRFGQAAAIDGDTIAVSALRDDRKGQSFTGSVAVFRRTEGWSLTSVLTNGGEQGGDRFGHSVDVSDGNFAVGAPHADSEEQSRTGAVYIFGHSRRGGKLIAEDGAVGDLFGYSVSIRGDFLVVGAPEAKGRAGLATGAAYLFRFVDGAWQQIRRIVAADGARGDRFGASVAVEGDVQTGLRLVVGAPDRRLEGRQTTGSVYVFEYFRPTDDGAACDEPDPHLP